MAYAYQKHTTRIGSAHEKHSPFIWNGSAWVEHSAYIYSELTNMWLYNNGVENADVTGGWISEGCSYLSNVAGTLRALEITKNANSMTVAKLNADFGGDTGVARISNEIDLTPYSTLRMKCDYTISNCTACLVVIPKGTTYWGNGPVCMNIPAYASANGAEFTVDVSALDSSYYVGIGMIGWDSSSTITVYEIELR